MGKYYYDLAELHNKSKWGFAILGITSYYVGTVVFAVIFTLVIEYLTAMSIDEINEFTINLMAIPFGILSCFGVYYLLKRTWEKNVIEEKYF